MAKPEIPEYLLAHNGIRLVLLEKSDLDLVRRWRNQDDIRTWFGDSGKISPTQQTNWYNAYLRKENDIVFVARSIAGGPIGMASLYNIDRQLRIAEFGRLIVGDSDVRGQGYGYGLTRMVCRIGFEAFDLNEIILSVRPDNRVASNIYRRLGFEADKENNGEMQSMHLRKSDFYRICGLTIWIA